MDINNVDFSDEVVSSFSYDSVGKEMQLTFHSFMHKGKSVTKSHTLQLVPGWRRRVEGGNPLCLMI